MKERFLTPNEISICMYLTNDLTYKEISSNLHISVKSFNQYIHKLRRKLQLKTTYGISAWWMKHININNCGCIDCPIYSKMLEIRKLTTKI